METRLSLRYAGPDVDAGRMDVYAASANMIAFSEFMVAAVKAAFGDQAEARAEVAGFAQGSFVTDIVFNLGGPLASVLSGISPKDLIAVVKESFDLWKHLKGAPPAAIDHHGQEVRVTNNSGHVIQVRAETINLVMSDKGADSVGRFVREALQPEGVESITVTAPADRVGDQPLAVASADRSEAACFVPVAVEAPLFDNTSRMALILEAAVFKDGNKWRFFDGQASFSADITDKEFLRRVEEGERFGKGDVLTVELRTLQTRTGAKISAQRTVLQVLDHRTGQEQKRLF